MACIETEGATLRPDDVVAVRVDSGLLTAGITGVVELVHTFDQYAGAEYVGTTWAMVRLDGAGVGWLYRVTDLELVYPHD